MARAGRKRKIEVVRDKNGISRNSRYIEKQYYAQTLARRGVDLEHDRLKPEHAGNPLAGFTLGRLFLLHQQAPEDPFGISEVQYNAGNMWAGIVHDHARLMGYKLSVKSPGFHLVSAGVSCSTEPTQEEIDRIRSRWKASYDALMESCRELDMGLRARDVTYGVCVENWPIRIISPDDVGKLRTSLNYIGRALRV
jgi:hypothetical protein